MLRQIMPSITTLFVIVCYCLIFYLLHRDSRFIQLNGCDLENVENAVWLTKEGHAIAF